MGDCLQAGKPSWYVTSCLGQLTLPSFWGRLFEYQPMWLGLKKRGWVHLCRVAGNCVLPYGRWRVVALDWPPIKSYNTTFNLFKPLDCVDRACGTASDKVFIACSATWQKAASRECSCWCHRLDQDIFTERSDNVPPTVLSAASEQRKYWHFFVSRVREKLWF